MPRNRGYVQLSNEVIFFAKLKTFKVASIPNMTSHNTARFRANVDKKNYKNSLLKYMTLGFLQCQVHHWSDLTIVVIWLFSLCGGCLGWFTWGLFNWGLLWLGCLLFRLLFCSLTKPRQTQFKMSVDKSTFVISMNMTACVAQPLLTETSFLQMNLRLHI